MAAVCCEEDSYILQRLKPEEQETLGPCMPCSWDVSPSNNAQISVMGCSLPEIP